MFEDVRTSAVATHLYLDQAAAIQQSQAYPISVCVAFVKGPMNNCKCCFVREGLVRHECLRIARGGEDRLL
jgi:hypothetical protein